MLGGLLFVFIGLFGYFPYVVDNAPRLSRVGVLSSALGGLALTVGLAGSIAVAITTNVTFGEGPSWGPPLLALAFVLVLLSFLTYGIGSSRSATPSRPIGYLLLVPFLAFLGQAVLLISKIVTGDVLPIIQLSLAGIAGVAVIAAGYLLRDETAPVRADEPRIDQAM
jgi:FtsH-binding integral membrane protein